MPEIQKLSADVVDQIAAGEVVERPSHLVKELVENSIDAGATEITVSYSLGGRSVKVQDNGHGIDKDQLRLALDRHATSKIHKADDLWSLKSFGFRGEALASIAAVSELSMTSKTSSQKAAYKLVSKFGVIEPVEVTGGDNGTTVSIHNLFENIPARLKFLKSDSAESSQIKSTLKALALAHPQVTLRVEENGKLTYFWKATKTFKERVENILELKNLIEGEAQREFVKAKVIFTDPSEVQKTSRNIWLFAQQRWVQDRSLQAAVMEAYRSLLMHGEFPSAVVWVETDPAMIDVNIHPTKSQVKFQDASLAFRAVQAAVRDQLLAKTGQVMATRSEASYASTSTPQNYQFQDASFHKTQYQQKDFTLASAEMAKNARENLWQTSLQNSNGNSNSSVENSFGHVNPEIPFVRNVLNDSATSVEGSKKFWSNLQVLGQAHLTYIVCQSESSLVFVDQHAAHERIAFEQLMSSWKNGKIDIQEFLFPLAFDLTPERVEVLQKEFETFKRLGITLEVLGPSTIGVKAAPLILKESSIYDAIEKISQELMTQGGSHRLERVIGDICATMACHSVIRAGQSLSLDQMKQLLSEMDQFPMSSFCPHGRPVSVEYPFPQLERDFGRIV